MFLIPRHYSTYNFTLRSADQCDIDDDDLSVSAAVSNATSASQPRNAERSDYPGWHLIFWISPYFQGLLVTFTFSITAYIVSHFTEPDGPVEERLLIELFQSNTYPAFIRRFFKLEYNVKRKECKLIEEEKLMSSQADSRADQTVNFVISNLSQKYK